MVWTGGCTVFVGLYMDSISGYLPKISALLAEEFCGLGAVFGEAGLF